MAQNIIESWLAELGYPVNGVGSYDCLNPTISPIGSQWNVKLEPGWFYLDNKEQYLFRSRRSQSFSLIAGSNDLTVLNTYPGWGPINIRGASTHYNRLFTTLLPAVNRTWVVHSGSVWRVTIPSNITFIGLRTINTLPPARFGSLSSVTNSQSDNVYYHNPDTNTLYLKASSNPNGVYFIDEVAEVPQIKYPEILIVDKNQQVTLTFKNAYNVVITRGATTLYSNVGPINGPITLSVSPGQWVRAEYHIDKSFIVKSPTEITAYTVSPDNITVNSELAPGTVSYLAKSGSNLININPIAPSKFGSGFLTARPVGGTFTVDVAEIILTASKYTYCSAWKEEVIIEVQVVDSNGLPCPDQNITITQNGTILTQYPSTRTGNDGKRVFRVTRASGNISFQVTLGALSKTITINDVSPNLLINSTKYSSGACNIVTLNEESTRLKTVAANTQSLDGIPRAGNIFLQSLNSVFILDGKEYRKALGVSVIPSGSNVGCITSFIRVNAQPNDVLYAIANQGQSRIVRVEEDV